MRETIGITGAPRGPQLRGVTGFAGAFAVLDQYIGVVITFALGAVIVLGMVSGSMIFGAAQHIATRRQGRSLRVRQPVRPVRRAAASRSISISVAILFIVFDVEVVFMYPWAIVFRQLGVPGSDRDAHLRRRPRVRSRVRLEARGAGVGLIEVGIARGQGPGSSC